MRPEKLQEALAIAAFRPALAQRKAYVWGRAGRGGGGGGGGGTHWLPDVTVPDPQAMRCCHA